MFGQPTIPDPVVLNQKLGQEYLAVAMQAYYKLSKINDSMVVKDPTYQYTKDIVIDGMVHEISICNICSNATLVCDVRIYSPSTRFPKRIIIFEYNWLTKHSEVTKIED